MTTLREQRQRPEIESAVIGCLLLQPDRFFEAAHLSPDDFTDEGRQRIFEAMKAVYAKGVPPDCTLVVNELRKTGKYSPEHGASVARVASFFDLAPSGYLLTRYIDAVRPKPAAIDHTAAIKRGPRR